MSIRFRLVAATLAVAVVAGALLLPFARARVDHGFDAFEADYVALERGRLADLLQDEAIRLGRVTLDYSRWDETVEFLEGKRPRWADENLTPDLFDNFGVDAIVVATKALDPVTTRSATGDVQPAVATELLRGGGLCEAAMKNLTFVWRFAWIAEKPQMAACAPITASHDLANPVGVMVWATILDMSRIDGIRSRVQFPFELHVVRPLPADTYTSDRIVAWLPVRNFDNDVGLVASLHLPRPLGAQRELTTHAMLLLIAAAVCIPSLLMLGFFEAVVVRPIHRLSQWVRGTREEVGSDGPRWSATRTAGFSELHMLAHEFAKAQDKIRQSNRVYAVLSSINSLIVRATDRDELFRQACRILVDTGRFAKTWIGLVDADAPPLRIVAWAGAEDGYFEDLQRRLVANAASSSTGLLGRTLASGAAVVCNDIANDSTVVERQKMLDSGSRSFALFPLLIGEHLVGAISIHARTVGFFDKEETDLLLELASDVSFALDHLLKADRIAHLAHHDALTGLPNRALFAALLQQELAEAARDGLGVCVALLDLVRFRRINETLGRRAGDDLLMQVAARLRKWNLSSARVSADVFAVRISGRDTTAELVRDFEHVASQCFGKPFHVGGEEMGLGCRIGAVVFPGDGDDAEELLRNAEAALRKARTSIEAFAFYETGMNTSVSEALVLESRLRKAIEHEEFILHYQPKFRLADRRICGVEALIRWRDPEHGLILPGQFIPVLEETGLIGVVGKWAMQRALEDAQEWKRQCGQLLRVAVNVSPLQLNQPNFIAQVAELASRYGGDALELEITESVIMDDVDRKIRMIEELRRLGVTVAVDDFGTGYSSLAHISRLPITSLKIDRAFINGMDEEPQRYSLVSSIVALARPLELTVVADGVETEAQARLLTLMRCDEAQGFLFSKPLDAGQLLERLAMDADGTIGPAHI